MDLLSSAASFNYHNHLPSLVLGVLFSLVPSRRVNDNGFDSAVIITPSIEIISVEMEHVCKAPIH